MRRAGVLTFGACGSATCGFLASPLLLAGDVSPIAVASGAMLGAGGLAAYFGNRILREKDQRLHMCRHPFRYGAPMGVITAISSSVVFGATIPYFFSWRAFFLRDSEPVEWDMLIMMMAGAPLAGISGAIVVSFVTIPAGAISGVLASLVMRRTAKNDGTDDDRPTTTTTTRDKQ